MSLMSKLKKNSTIKEAEAMSSTKYFNDRRMVPCSVPALNIALRGSLSGGFSGGLGQICGPSKHFKSSIMLVMVAAFQKKYPDGVILFYDSEYGSPPAYFNSFGIDLDRVFHTPIVNVEQMKSDVMVQLEAIERGDNVMIIVDSIGNLASAKEISNALEENHAADFTRAKQFKSFFRMVTPYLNTKDIPMVCINHTYQTMETYSKQVVGGGTGSIYSSDWIIIVGKQQEKEGTDVIGYNFILNIEKSRFVREKSKIPLEVTFDGGISTWSGLLDIALESGHVVKPSNGWYSRVNTESGEVEEKKWRAKDTNSAEFWLPVLKDKSFNAWIEARYRIAAKDMISEEELDSAIDEEYQNAE